MVVGCLLTVDSLSILDVQNCARLVANPVRSVLSSQSTRLVGQQVKVMPWCSGPGSTRRLTLHLARKNGAYRLQMLPLSSIPTAGRRVTVVVRLGSMPGRATI